MEKKELTKLLLADTLKEQMIIKDFDKITIRRITDAAGVIRPTFYNYFRDKYEVLEWIVDSELIGPMRELAGGGKLKESLLHLFKTVSENRDFYRRAFCVTGQNGFSEMMIRKIGVLIFEYKKKNGLTINSENRLLTREVVAGRFAVDIVTVENILSSTEFISATPEEELDAYVWLVTHPLQQLING